MSARIANERTTRLRRAAKPPPSVCLAPWRLADMMPRPGTPHTAMHDVPARYFITMRYPRAETCQVIGVRKIGKNFLARGIIFLQTRAAKGVAAQNYATGRRRRVPSRTGGTQKGRLRRVRRRPQGSRGGQYRIRTCGLWLRRREASRAYFRKSQKIATDAGGVVGASACPDHPLPQPEIYPSLYPCGVAA